MAPGQLWFPVINVYKTYFFFVNHVLEEFQPCLIFVGKARSLPEERVCTPPGKADPYLKYQARLK
jgi:hypothetical protein